MGPEEIHICFWEGALGPPKRKCDRPKNLEVFLVHFLSSCCCSFSYVVGEWVAGIIEIKANTAQAMLKLELWLSLAIKLN